MAWIDNLFKIMAEQKASDLHVTSEHVPMIRAAGDMVPLPGAPKLNKDQLQQILFEICPERNKKQWEETNDTDFAYALEGVGRFRCNVFKALGRKSAAIRRVKPKIPTYEELNLPTQIRKCAEFEQGLVLVGGITGSGKSTSLAAVLDDINHRRRCHIVTIEDPVEYVFADDKAVINQREVFTDVASFDDALRSCVREDPDVMLLGEMRDGPTFETALTAAETGHLVFGTIHASGAAQTLGRIMDLFPTEKHPQIRTSLAFNLRCILNQKLLKGMSKEVPRVPALESMYMTPIIRKCILDREDQRIAEAIRQDRDNDCENYNRVLERLLKAKLISMDTALKAAPNAEELRMAMSGITISEQGGIV